MNNHTQNLESWLKAQIKEPFQLNPIKGDASTREYYRVSSSKHSWVAMLAPPENNDNATFIKTADLFRAQNLHVPEIFASDLDNGFLLLSDLGDRLLEFELNDQNADQIYQSAIQDIVKIQASENKAVPDYDQKLLLDELTWFSNWYYTQYLKNTITPSVQKLISKTFNGLIDNALNQPQVLVHRDYHSRNLLLDNDKIGVIDFQDAVWGPISYDLVSLIKDAYIDWPIDKVSGWVDYFYDLLNADFSRDQFIEWFDLMGMQRHLKCIGLFPRLAIRDNKPDYLVNLPRVQKYLLHASEKHTQFKEFNLLLQDCMT